MGLRGHDPTLWGVHGLILGPLASPLARLQRRRARDLPRSPTGSLAGWCRYLQGTDDDGRPIELAADPHLDEAQRHAAEAADDPRAFLGYERVFGSVGDDERLASAFVRALERIRDLGVRPALDATLDERRP